MKVGILQFPGSNCDKDIGNILNIFFKLQTTYIWYKESFNKKFDLLILPGGFSFGDYLRPGALAKFSPAMLNLSEHVNRGGAVVGICNGFQILCEAGYLPGALIKNKNLKHICKKVNLKVNQYNNFTSSLKSQNTYSLPISHSDGNFFADENTIKSLIDNNQIAYTYTENPNGSIENIAGISSKNMRILGLMPHPERAVDPVSSGGNGIKGQIDGKVLLQAILNAV